MHGLEPPIVCRSYKRDLSFLLLNSFVSFSIKLKNNQKGKLNPSRTWSWFPCTTSHIGPNIFLHISCDYPSATNTKQN